MTKEEPIADEDPDRLLSSSFDVADGRLRGGAGHPRVVADRVALHRAHSQLHLDRGDVALPVHLDGDARRDDRHPRRHALRGRYLARARAAGERGAAHCLPPVRARVRVGVPLLGSEVRAVRLVPGIRACRAAHAVHLPRLAASRRDVAAVCGRGVSRQLPCPRGQGHRMTAVALSPGMAALILFGAFFILIALRVPVAFALGLACLPLLAYDHRLSPMVLFNETFKAYNAFILLAVPFFLLTANLMNIGGITERLVRLSRTMVGNWPGSLAQINVLLSVFFAGISGSSTADAASQSKIFIEAQTREGYDLSFSIAITAVSAVLAVIIPPSILMIVWGGVLSVSIGALYLAGILPGLLIAAAQMATVHVYAKLYKYPVYPRATFRDFLCSAAHSMPALMTPFIIVGGILLGWFTATESACVAVIYAALLSIFIYREMDLKRLHHALAETGRLSAVALFCVGTASALGWMLAYYQIPRALLANVTTWGMGITEVGFFIAFVFLIVGCFLDAIPAIAIIGTVSLAFGLVTPPYGLCLMISCAVAGVRLRYALKDTMIMLVPMIIVLAAMIVWPDIALFLPRLIAPDLMK